MCLISIYLFKSAHLISAAKNWLGTFWNSTRKVFTPEAESRLKWQARWWKDDFYYQENVLGLLWPPGQPDEENGSVSLIRKNFCREFELQKKLSGPSAPLLKYLAGYEKTGKPHRRGLCFGFF